MSTAAAASAPAQGAAPTAPLDPVKARLIAETGSIAPGKTLWVDLHLDIAPGWHIYWRNPGDSGLPTEIAWTLPAGLQRRRDRLAGAGALCRGRRSAITAISGSADLLVPIAVPASLEPGGPVRLEANASWLVCSDICIPGEAQARARPAGRRRRACRPIRRSRRCSPRRAAACRSLPVSQTRFAVRRRSCGCPLPAAALAGIDQPRVSFFPLTPTSSMPRPNRNRSRAPAASTWCWRAPAAPPRPCRTTLAGVVALRGADGAERGLRDRGAARRRAGAGRAIAAVGWWQALLLAFVGGVAAEPDAVRLPGAVAEAARPRRIGPSRRGAPPRRRLCRGRHPQLRRCSAASCWCCAPAAPRSAGGSSCNRRSSSGCSPICCSRWG